MSSRARHNGMRASGDPEMSVAWRIEHLEVTETEERVCREAAKALAAGEVTKHGNEKTEGPGLIIDRELPDVPFERRMTLCKLALEMEREAS